MSVRRISDTACRMSHRSRLGIPVVNSIAEYQCLCGRRFVTGSHMLGCMMMREGEITNRHNKIVRILVNFINRMGASATDLEVERRQYKSMVNINERPDIRAWIGEAQLIINVTVTHPTAKSNITKALKPLGAADSAHKRKTRKHEKAAEKVGATLVPYVV